MALTDSPSGRSQATAMRDLLRALDREIYASKPARPTEPPAFALARAAAPTTVRIGSWTLIEDPESGALIAVDSDGGSHVLATKGSQ